MLVGTKALGPGSFTELLVARAHKKASHRKNMLVGLTLTSMVDMFSLLVIFLLQTFSSSPELLIVTKGITLPIAATGQEIKDAPLLSLSKAGVFLDQKRIGSITAILHNPTPLMDKLSDQRDLWERTHPDQKFPGEVNVQADKDLSSAVVSQFMGMLPSQAYGSMQLAVVSGGNNAEGK